MHNEPRMKSRAKANKQITRMGQDGGQPSAAILMVIIVSLALALDFMLGSVVYLSV